MKMPTRALLALLCVLAMHADVSAQRKVHERHAVVPSGFIRIFVQNGDVQVVGWDRDSLVVTGTIDDAASEFGVGITPRGAKIGSWNDEQADAKPAQLTIYLPRGSNVWVKTTGASISVSSVSGGLDLFSVSGPITVAGAPRQIYAETMAGALHLLNAKTPSARLKTASGELRINGDIADLTAITVSGAITTALASFGRARLESVEGHIRYYGGLPGGSHLDVINHSGAITLAISPRTSADFVFNLYDADLHDEFGFRKRWLTAKQKTSEVTFGLGERPTARVVIRSFKGPVIVRKLGVVK